MPRFSVIIPIYAMNNWEYFLKRCLDSVYSQTFTDYEIIITVDGKMAENTNSGIEKSRGELIKILYMDDYLSDENSLQRIHDEFTDSINWLATGCYHDIGTENYLNPHLPMWSENMTKGENTIGSPSVITMRGNKSLLFDTGMSWMLDADLYQRMYELYGVPKLLNEYNVTIGLGRHQHTNILTDQDKLIEQQQLYEKHTT